MDSTDKRREKEKEREDGQRRLPRRIWAAMTPPERERLKKALAAMVEASDEIRRLTPLLSSARMYTNDIDTEERPDLKPPASDPTLFEDANLLSYFDVHPDDFLKGIAKWEAEGQSDFDQYAAGGE